MSLGLPIPRLDQRVYYRMENVNDSSGNGRNLTNIGSVDFNAGRFNQCADFGTTGDNKALDLTANPLSADQVANITFAFWFKLNNITAHNSTSSNIFGVNTDVAAATGCRTNIHYTISGGNITIGCRTTLTTTNASIDYTITADTVWRYFVLVKSSTTTLTLYVNGLQVGTNTGSGTDASVVAVGDCMAIGNARNLPTKEAAMWAEIEEFIIEERAFTANEIKKYYARYRGFRVAS